jgi:23S rRNA pseudouridine1911/1915/1917 synthase
MAAVTGVIEKIYVDKTIPGLRLDSFLHLQHPELSRTYFKKLIDSAKVSVNGRTIKPSYQPIAGDLILIEIPEPTSTDVKPEAIPLNIIYEDEDIVVINKPSGVVVHPGAGNINHTIVNALLHHCEGKLSGISGVMRPGIVHRLDKETSGCLVAAKNDIAHQSLMRQFASRNVKKSYLAIVCGQLSQKTGEINLPIGRHPVHRKKMAVVKVSGRTARTGYTVITSTEFVTFVDLRLYTGRTHQIRVHFHHIGFSVLGDSVYGARQTEKVFKTTGYNADRQMLHAYILGFFHPRTTQWMEFKAELPDDFKTALHMLSLDHVDDRYVL